MRIINLLPKQEQEMLQQEKLLSSLRHLMYFSFSYVLVVVIWFAARMQMQQNLSGLDSQIKMEQSIVSKSDNAAITNQVNFNNGAITDYNSLAATNPAWSKVLEEFAKLVPQGVTVSRFTGDASTGQIAISGTSLTRDAVLQLRSNILSSALFKNIDLPLGNLEKPANLSWNYTFYVDLNQLASQP